MQKIVIIGNHDIGIYNFRKELIEKLIQKKNKVYVFAPDGIKTKDLQDLGCHCIDIKVDRRGTNFIKDLKLVFSYLKHIKKIKPNIVFTYTIKPNVYAGIACRLLKVPYIANITGLGTAVSQNGLLQCVTLFLYKYALQNAKTVFFQNQSNMNFFVQKKIAIGKQKLIPGSGVNLEDFYLLEYPNDKVINFLFISRIMKEKGVYEYLKAAEIIQKKYKNVQFHICGFCEDNSKKELLYYECAGIIKYHGEISNVHNFLKNIHCVIHPSYYPEGISNVCLEAASSGRPVITTDKVGCKETVDDMVSGYIIEAKNVEMLVKKIKMFLSLSLEEKRKMGLNGRKKVEKEFNRMIIVNDYLNEID